VLKSNFGHLDDLILNIAAIAKSFPQSVSSFFRLNTGFLLLSRLRIDWRPRVVDNNGTPPEEKSGQVIIFGKIYKKIEQ
jgi:hypothetical protein